MIYVDTSSSDSDYSIAIGGAAGGAVLLIAIIVIVIIVVILYIIRKNREKKDFLGNKRSHYETSNVVCYNKVFTTDHDDSNVGAMYMQVMNATSPTNHQQLENTYTELSKG